MFTPFKIHLVYHRGIDFCQGIYINRIKACASYFHIADGIANIEDVKFVIKSGKILLFDKSRCESFEYFEKKNKDQIIAGGQHTQQDRYFLSSKIKHYDNDGVLNT